MKAPPTEDTSHAGTSGLMSVAPVIIGAILAGYALHATFGGTRTKFEDLGLGINTVNHLGTYEGEPIHGRDAREATYQPGDPPTIQQVVASWKRRGEPPAAISLGNSQLHGINQYKDGQENAAEMLFKRLKPRGIEVLTFTQPSASLQEHYVLFEYLLPQLHPKFLILPVVFINQRSSEVRENIAVCLSDPATRDALEQTEVGRRILERFAPGGEEAPGNETAALDKTTQEVAENFLTDWLKEHWSLWALRPEARGHILDLMIRTRNTALGISGQSKRHMIRGAYEANIEALAAILASARAHDVRVLVYIAPIRHDAEPPYIAEEYDACRRQVQEVAEEHGAVFADLDDAVPSEYYGVHNSRVFGRESQPDFFHFQEEAHRRLAAALGDLVETHILTQQASP
jgi:lysophospholipase L1-like esterase